MSKRKPLTDADIDAARRDGAHRRGQCIDTTVMIVIIAFIAAFGFLGIWGIFEGGSIYIKYIHDPKSVDAKSLETIQTIATHVIAAIGGYVVHIAKRVTGVHD